MTDTHDKELVEAVMNTPLSSFEGDYVFDAITKRELRIILSAARPHLEKQVRAEVLRDLQKVLSNPDGFGDILTDEDLDAYASEHNIDLTAEEKG